MKFSDKHIWSFLNTLPMCVGLLLKTITNENERHNCPLLPVLNSACTFECVNYILNNINHATFSSTHPKTHF